MLSSELGLVDSVDTGVVHTNEEAIIDGNT